MDWLGIGVLIIGVALLILVFVLISPLAKLSTILDGVRKSTEKIPEILDDNATEAHTVLKNVNVTLENVNKQINAVHPLFRIVEDVGLAAREVSLKWLNKTNTLKEQSSETQSLTEHQTYKGLYGVLSFIFYLFRNKEGLTKATEALKKNSN